MSIHSNNATNPNLFTVNGTAVIIPNRISYTRSDLDSENSFRTITGEMVRDRICTKRTLDCEWSALSGSEMSQLLQAIDNTFFSIGFIDPFSNSFTTMICYSGDKTPVTSYYDHNREEMIYESFSCSFIEK